MKKIIIRILLFVASVSIIYPNNDGVFKVGEELKYSVKYIGITLGYITVSNEEFSKFGGKDSYSIKGEIKSAPGIPFAKIHQILTSKVHPSGKYTLHADAKMLEDDQWRYDTLFCDYKEKEMVFTSTFNEVQEDKKVYKIKKAWNDGISLFFLARKFLDSKYNIRVPTFMGVDTASTKLNFTDKTEFIEIDAYKKPIKTKYFFGEALWKGPYGLEGKFEGWFSDDEAHVPIYAKVELIVGNVIIELEEWERENWTPPTN